jgi:hypothetical protein
MDKLAVEEVKTDRVNNRTTITQPRKRNWAQHGHLDGARKVIVSKCSDIQLETRSRVKNPRAVSLCFVSARFEGQRQDGVLF